jgi:isocitrate dehydrogenase
VRFRRPSDKDRHQSSGDHADEVAVPQISSLGRAAGRNIDDQAEHVLFMAAFGTIVSRAGK